MLGRARDGVPLDEIVSVVAIYCRAAAERLPRGPGAPPTIPGWVLAVMVLVGVLLRKKTKNAQYVWWTAHQSDFQRWFPQQRFPARSTFYDRYRRVAPILQRAIELQGTDAVRKGWAQAETVAMTS